jgi:hypothetical protein
MKSRPRVAIIQLIVFTLCISSFSITALAKDNYKIIMTLEPPDPQSIENFGYPVFITENRILVGDADATVNGYTNAGKVYIFDLDGNHIASIQPPDPDFSGLFSEALLGNEDTLFVGEHGSSIDTQSEAGLVHVYDIDGNYLKSIQSPEPADDTHFGASLAFIDDLIVSVDDAEVDGVFKAGRVYIMNLDEELHMTLQSPEPQERGLFGYPLTTGYGKIVCSETGASPDYKLHAGRVHIFETDGTFLATLESPNPQTSGRFGNMFALYEDIIVVKEGYPEEEEVGLVHVFNIDGDFLMTLRSPESEEEMIFGTSIAVNEEYIFVGEITDEEEDGRIHVFDREGILLSTLFGFDGVTFLGVYGDLVVVGDTGEGKVSFLELEILLASFDLSNLDIEPSSVKEGDSVSISCDITNTGTVAGSHTVTLKIDGEIIEEKKVSLDIGDSETVSFDVVCENVGEFNVDVNGKTGNYEVTKAQTGIPGFPIISILAAMVIYYLIHEFGK